MKIVSLTYVNASTYDRPEDWISFLKPYLGILEELANEHEVHCIEQINYNGEYTQNGVRYSFRNYGKRITRFPFRLHRFIKSLDPELVLVRGLHFPLQTLLLRRALGPGVSIFVQHHAGASPTGLVKWLQRKADSIIDGYFFAALENAEEWVKTGAIRDRSKIHEIGMLSSSFKPAEKRISWQTIGISEPLVYLWVGQLTTNKDPVPVVKAFIQFAAKHSRAKLYMLYQDGTLLSEVEAARNLHPEGSNRVVLVGKVRHAQMEDWFNSADFYISGSHAESYGVALCEAMSCGCIPVVTDIPSFRKMTKDGKLGFLFNPGKANELVGILHKSAEINMEPARAAVLQHFSEELSFKAIANKINKILNART